MRHHLTSSWRTVRYAFILLSLIGVGTPYGHVVAQDGSIPVIQPLVRYESVWKTKLIGANQVIALSDTDTKIEVKLRTLNGSNWQEEVLLSAACNDCHTPKWIWGNANTTVIVQMYDRALSRDRSWLLAQTPSQSWKSVDITDILQGQPYDYNFAILDDAVYFRSSFFDPSQNVLWRLTEIGWEFYTDFDFPVATSDPVYAAAFAGTLDDFIHINEITGQIHNHINNNGTWNRVGINLPDVVPQGHLAQPNLIGDTLLIQVPSQDIDLPNQGAVHLLTRESTGVWSHEAVIARRTTYGKGPYDSIGSTLLASDSVAIVEARAYLRDANANWNLITGLSTSGWQANIDSNDLNFIWQVFVDGNKLTWQESDSSYRFSSTWSDLNFSAWTANPVCTGLDATGVGSTGTTLCTVQPFTPLLEIDDLETTPEVVEITLLNSDEDPIDTTVLMRNNGRGSLTETRYSLASDTWITDTFNICYSQGLSTPENSDQCGVWNYSSGSGTLFASVFTSEPSENSVYLGTRDTNGQLSWKQFANGMASVHDLVVEDNIGVIVHNTLGTVLLQIIAKDNADVWNTAGEFELDRIGIFGSWSNEFSIDNGRIVIGDVGRSKYHVLALTEEGNLYYETSISPPNIPNAHYITSDLHGDTLIVGGSLGRGSDDNTSITGRLELGAPGVVRIYQANAYGDWREVQELNARGTETNLGQQVFLSDNYAVAMSLRSYEDDSFTYFQPNYNIYKKIGASSWEYKTRIEPDLPARHCADCSFQQDIRWSAKVIDQYLFLSSVSATSVFDMETEQNIAFDDVVISNNTDSNSSVDINMTEDSITLDSDENSPLTPDGNNSQPLESVTINSEGGGGGALGVGFIIFLALLLAPWNARHKPIIYNSSPM